MKQSRSHRYEVYYAFTVLDFCENVRRNKLRAVTATRLYLTDRKLKSAPRLPNVEEKYMEDVTRQVGQNLWDLMGRKLYGKLDDVDHIIVFDNSVPKRTIRVLYNSDKTQSMVGLVHAIEKIKKVRCIRRCTLRSDPRN